MSMIDKLPGPIGQVARWASNGHSVAKISRLPVYVLFLMLICVGVLWGSYYAEYRLIATVTKDSAPSVALFHQIEAQFARMLEAFLVERNGKPGENFDQTKDFAVANDLLRKARIEATRNITYAPGLDNFDPNLYPSEPDGELGVIMRLEQHRDQLMEIVAQTRVWHDKHDAANLYGARTAYKLVVDKLIADAQAGAAVNEAYLEHGYAQRQAVFKEVMLWDGGVAIFFFAFMAGGFYIVFRRFKRGVNVWLLGATAIAAIGFYNAYDSFKTANYHLEQFKENAFDSINPLVDMQAAVYQLRAVQALSLIDNANPADNAKAIDQLVARIGKLGPKASYEDAIAAASSGYARDNGVPRKLQSLKVWPVTENIMTGKLADELNNLTWPGEFEAATNTVRAYAQFTTVWTQVQQLVAQGQRESAIKLFSGNSPGQGGYLLKQLVDEESNLGTLGTTIKLNKDAADEHKDAAFAAIRHIKWGALIAGFAIWLLTVIGVMRQRAGANPARAARKRVNYAS